MLPFLESIEDHQIVVVGCRPAWDLDALAGILVAAGRLAAGGRDWIASLDVHPLLCGPAGFQAVDALLLLRPA